MPKHYPRNPAIEDASTMEQLGREAYRLHKRVHDLEATEMALSDYKTWYDEAMCASNEAGFSGVSAAHTIRDLDSDNSRLTRERDQALVDRNLVVELLAKYRQHVQDCESIDFLDQIGESGVTFTPAEKAALLALRGAPPVAWKGNEAEHDAQLREYLENRHD